VLTAAEIEEWNMTTADKWTVEELGFDYDGRWAVCDERTECPETAVCIVRSEAEALEIANAHNAAIAADRRRD
jgi:hypothetical protein